MNQRYERALVTGASSGLGRAFARMLLDEGIAVTGLSRRPDVFPDDDGYTGMSCDLADADAVGAAVGAIFEGANAPDLVINNAGFGCLGPIEDQDAAAIESQVAVMLAAPIRIASAACGSFRRAGAGCLVNVSSLAVELPLPCMPVYNACKAGLSAFSESLRLDAAEAPYTVVDFRPGDFNTPFAERMRGRVRWNGQDLRAVMDRHHARAPDVSVAVAELARVLRRPRPGTVRTGDFFQSRIAPLGRRLLPVELLHALIRFYYRR